MDLHLMGADEAAAAMRAGEITAEELVQACLDHIAAYWSATLIASIFSIGWP